VHTIKERFIIIGNKGCTVAVLSIYFNNLLKCSLLCWSSY